MDKNVVFMIAALAALYYLLDDFIGNRKITNLVDGWFNANSPQAGATPAAPPAITDPNVQAGINKTPQVGGSGTGQTPDRAGIATAGFKPTTTVITTI